MLSSVDSNVYVSNYMLSSADSNIYVINEMLYLVESEGMWSMKAGSWFKSILVRRVLFFLQLNISTLLSDLIIQKKKKRIFADQI